LRPESRVRRTVKGGAQAPPLTRPLAWVFVDPDMPRLTNGRRQAGELGLPSANWAGLFGKLL